MNQPDENYRDSWEQPAAPEPTQPQPAFPPASPPPPPRTPPGLTAPLPGAGGPGSRGIQFPPSPPNPSPTAQPPAGTAVPPPENLYPPEPTRKGKSAAPLIIVAIVLALVLIAGLAWTFLQFRGGGDQEITSGQLEIVTDDDVFVPADDSQEPDATVSAPNPGVGDSPSVPGASAGPGASESAADLSRHGFPAGTTCPSGGRVFVVQASDDGNVRASICADSAGNYTYRGYTTSQGVSPVLPAQMYGDNFKANNGVTEYVMWPRSIEVTVNGRTELDAPSSIVFGPRTYDSY